MAVNLERSQTYHSSSDIEVGLIHAQADTSEEGVETGALSRLELLPLELLFTIFKNIGDDRSLASLRGASSSLCRDVDAFLSFKERQFQIISSTLPRPLSPLEQREPLLKRLAIIKGIINSVDTIGRTPLIKAALEASMDKGKLKLVKRLLFLGADPQMKVKNDWTVRDFTAFWHFDDIDDFICKEVRKYISDAAIIQEVVFKER